MSALSAIYGQVARRRRSWYEGRPHAWRRLDRPVISIGNLVVGGSGKTPVVAAVARILIDAGHRPAVLSRGYGRRRDAEGVVVVSDGDRVLVPVERSGDEPQMLARALRGVPVLVSSDRYLAGRLAERRFGATVLLLDDGFQHLGLARDLDLLLVAPADLDERLLPSGRLREPLSAARFADAVLVPGTAEEAARVAAALGVRTAFTMTRSYADLRLLRGREDAGGPEGPPLRLRCGPPDQPPPRLRRPAEASAKAEGGPHGGTRVVAVAGIARPERFFTALREQGWEIACELAFRDHHWYSARDVERIAKRAREVHADLVVTTEKDAVRLETLVAGTAADVAPSHLRTPAPPHGPSGDADLAWAVLPMQAVIEPAGAFSSWVASKCGVAGDQLDRRSRDQESSVLK